MGGPGSPAVTGILVDFDGAVEVSGDVAGSLAAAASAPVDLRHSNSYLVDLPEAHISATVAVVVHGMGIASAFVRDDALAAGLVPVVLAAPCGNVLNVLGGAAVAGRTLAGGAVAAAGISQ